jgi:hypothetical protein
MAAVADIQDPVEKMSEFFSRLSQSQFAVLKISMRPHVESALSIGGLLDVIAQEQVPVYIKSTRTAGGVMILRVEGDGQGMA